jgi:hypothetical protein
VQIHTNRKFFYTASLEQPRFIQNQRAKLLQHKQRANVQIHTKRKIFFTQQAKSNQDSFKIKEQCYNISKERTCKFRQTKSFFTQQAKSNQDSFKEQDFYSTSKERTCKFTQKESFFTQ